jgi:hypothetical protein
MTFGIDAFNVLNRVNDIGYIGTLSSPFFGRAVAAHSPRRVQLSVGRVSEIEYETPAAYLEGSNNAL